MRRLCYLILALLLAAPTFAQNIFSTANPTGGQITAAATNCTTTPNGCVWMKLPANTASVAVTISGTFSATVVVEVSADGGNNFATSATFTIPETAVQFSTAGFTDIRVRASSYASGIASVTIQGSNAPGGISLSNVSGGSDPCQNPGIAKSSVAINVSSAATTSLVSVVAGKAVYVCGVTITIAPSATSADTATFEYGTGAACSSPTALTGPFGTGDLTTAAPPLLVTLADPGTSMTAPSGNGVCILSAGTTVAIAGILEYVQQ